MQLFIISILFAFLLSFSGVPALTCYSCSICQIPFNKSNAQTFDGCQHCLLAQTLINDDVRLEVRGCVPLCAAQELISGGSGVRTSCCTTDLCNGSPTLLPNIILFTAILLAWSMMQTN